MLKYLASLGLACLLLAAPAWADSTPNTFKTKCSPALTAQMDPIVHPGAFPAGHLHEFFGNTSIGPSSTGSQLQTDGNTTCADRFDTAAYWVPVLYRNGVRVPPTGVDVYYQRIGGLRDSGGSLFSMVNVPPTDFRMIAGLSGSPIPLPISRIHWTCHGPGAPTTPFTAPPACSGDLFGQVIFPGCWDGQTDLLANNTNNVAYQKNNQCPVGFDTPIPTLLLSIHYGSAPLPDCHLSRPPCDTYTLSELNEQTGVLDNQGSIYGYHADWLNGWNTTLDSGYVSEGEPRAMDFPSLIQACDNNPTGSTACDVQTSNPTGDSFVNFG